MIREEPEGDRKRNSPQVSQKVGGWRRVGDQELWSLCSC